jgi:predicted enzyme related to lactoylglutathione lyase
MTNATANISIDVPDLEQGLRFYRDVFGFQETARPFPGLVVLRAPNLSICLLEKKVGTKPANGTKDRRKYSRHWTPVHVDFHVDDLYSVLARAKSAGAVCEALHENPRHGAVAFCSDPFGHGFCLIESAKKS